MDSGEYSVVFDEEAAKELGDFGKADRQVFARAIKRLCKDRRACNATRMKGASVPLWRAWANRDLRVIYELNTKERLIRILSVQKKREDTYDDIKKWEKRVKQW